MTTKDVISYQRVEALREKDRGRVAVAILISIADLAAGLCFAWKMYSNWTFLRSERQDFYGLEFALFGVPLCFAFLGIVSSIALYLIFTQRASRLAGTKIILVFVLVGLAIGTPIFCWCRFE